MLVASFRHNQNLIRGLAKTFFIDVQYRKVNACFPQPSGEINQIQWKGFR